MLEELKQGVLRANLSLSDSGLAPATFGNVSGIDRPSGLVVIKPSGVAYAELKPADMAVVDLAGKKVEGLDPSTDTPSHLALYQAWPVIGGITHAHSLYATIFAQALRPIPCLGTTHADFFRGEVPLTRALTKEEVENDYELNTGRVIVERMAGLDPAAIPAVLVASHGPFAFGADAAASVQNARALETVAHMALAAIQLNPAVTPIPDYLLEKHYQRKHGPAAYYGQNKK
ncbi:MAG TPA: L-ribulose-5-phosphate 4-epimerase AraD [bacterium]|nr:L-ribulose-5-phosphate 4-epimerase AraD [bacterium]